MWVSSIFVFLFCYWIQTLNQICINFFRKTTSWTMCERSHLPKYSVSGKSKRFLKKGTLRPIPWNNRFPCFWNIFYVNNWDPPPNVNGKTVAGCQHFDEYYRPVVWPFCCFSGMVKKKMFCLSKSYFKIVYCQTTNTHTSKSRRLGKNAS